jgi:nucleoside-diphosphate-sugar epimerase
MNIVITGGGGMLGRRLATALLQRGYVASPERTEINIKKLVVFDRFAPEPALPDDARLEVMTGDITDLQVVNALIGQDTDLVFHLAAIVSGEAEENFDLGMQVNLMATYHLLEACRRLQTQPRFVFASSVAVFGGDMPAVIEDGTSLTPQTSYGTQKAIGELLVSDYSRKGFVDGRALRLPTIVVRPGKPNRAASTFASSIIREPLQGQLAICPVSPEARMWILSPRRAIESFIYAAELPARAWGSYRGVALPGISVTIQEMVDSLREIAGPKVVARIRWEPDPFIEKLVYGWPVNFAPRRAEAMGFRGDGSMREIIQSFIDDELGSKFVD